MPCPTKDRLKQASGARVTSLFTRVTNCRGTRVARFFKTTGQRLKIAVTIIKTIHCVSHEGCGTDWDSGTAIS